MSAANRRQTLMTKLKPLGVDALVISKPVNVTYLTGFTGEASYLIVGPSDCLLVSDGRFKEQLDEECPGLPVHIRPPTTTTPPAVAETVERLGYRKVGIEAGHVTVALLELWKQTAKTIDWAPTTKLVEEMRANKDDDEISQIRDAIGIAERAYAMLRASINADATEQELCSDLEQFIRRAGGQSTSFPSIVAVGLRSALAHAPPTHRSVAEADFLLVDWGARGPLYVSDLTRIMVTRKSWFRSRNDRARQDDARLSEVYQAVLTAQERAIAAIRPGAKARDIDAAARGALADAGFGDAFSHGLGHGIGLEVHESPDLRASSEDVLRPGMVITIEPGAYFAGWGGVRIEDDILVTPDGHERLSTLPRDFDSTRIP